MASKYDFCGYATRNNIKCSDGRTIRKDAFKDNDGQTVPLVWQHSHSDPANVLGHALLENREDGVYTYGKFNDTDAGRNAKALVEHGDITALSIYANKLKQSGTNVLHGAIREVSLVLAGANPGAYIESLAVIHGEDADYEEAIIYSGENLELAHAEEDKTKEPEKKEEKPVASEKTVQDVFDELTEEQKTVVYALIGQAIEDAKGGDDEEDDDVKHNVFDGSAEYVGSATLSHAEIEAIFDDAKRMGSLRDAVLEHTATYGIEDIDWLFPDVKNLNTPPDLIKRETGWVQQLMGAVHHTPFSRVKSMFADITADDARAKGYIKGNQKTEEVFTLLKRQTLPQTIYKKQKLDRDDVIDITDFDVVAWIKAEMRMMLDEEIARAVLIGDGRSSASDDKISEDHIRPIWTDASLYTINKTIPVAANATEDEKAKAFIRGCVKARKDYKGTGNPILFTTEDMLTDMLLLEDTTGRIIYDSVDKLATALRVSKIVTVEVMENKTRTISSVVHTLGGIIVNPVDYNIGADKGGAVSMFDDFDIDVNQMKYLIETRCSGALIKPYSAIAVEFIPAT